MVAETEEVSNFWAQVKDSDFAENEKAKANFVSVVIPLFKKINKLSEYLPCRVF